MKFSVLPRNLETVFSQPVPCQRASRELFRSGKFLFQEILFHLSIPCQERAFPQCQLSQRRNLLILFHIFSIFSPDFFLPNPQNSSADFFPPIVLIVLMPRDGEHPVQSELFFSRVLQNNFQVSLRLSFFLR